MLATISLLRAFLVFTALGSAVPLDVSREGSAPAKVSSSVPRAICENDPNVVAGTYVESLGSKRRMANIQCWG